MGSGVLMCGAFVVVEEEMRMMVGDEYMVIEDGVKVAKEQGLGEGEGGEAAT